MKHFLVLLSLVLSVTFASAQTSAKKHKAKTQSASLKGSRTSQARQNRNADKNNLSRIKNRKELHSMIKNGYLVPIWRGVTVDHRLRSEFRYVRPWVNVQLKDMTYRFHSERKTKKKFIITSATRTIAYQLLLQGYNGNAAGITGPYRTSHPTGSTYDVSKRNLTKSEIGWVRNYYISNERKIKLEATEEFHQSVFHVMAFKEAWKVPKKPKFKIIYPKHPTLQMGDTFARKK